MLIARKPWLEQRLQELSLIFAIDLDGFAIMDNHLHLVLTLRPRLVERCSSKEIARRWLRLHPPVAAAGERREATAEEVARLAADEGRIERLRERLCDLGEYHKALKEPLARLVNREEGITGHFWNERFKSRRVLDKEALLVTAIYVDLNPIRAQMAETPETSAFTSVWHRSRAWARARRGRAKQHGRSAQVTLDAEPAPSFLTPIRATRGKRGLFRHLTLEQYLTLVDRIGRVLRSGKRGRIPRDLPPILDRLLKQPLAGAHLDARRVVEEIASAAKWFGSVLGTRASCAAEATRCNRRRLVSALRLDGG
jgi:REP element-mobilizing transposase RayT